MKRRFTILTAALALLVSLAIPMGVRGQTTYEQLTSIANIDENAQYVLGIDGVGFHYSNTSGWGLTGLPADHTPYYYRLVVAADGQSFKAYVDTPIYGNTYYMTIPTTNAFTMTTNSSADNTDLIIGTTCTGVSTPNYAVANKGTTARHLRRNGSSGLRSYAGTTGSVAFFYKVVTSSGPTQLEAPTLTATPNSGKVTLTWNSVDGASSYTIQYADNSSFTNATTITNATSPKEISGLTNGTTYYFKAMSVGDGTDYISSDYGATVSATPDNIATITITQDDIADFTNVYAWYDWSDSGVSGKLYAYKNGGMQFNSSKDAYWIYNTTAVPGNITSVKISKASGTDRSWTLKAGNSALTTTSDGTQIGNAQTVGTNGATWNVTGGYSYFLLYVSGGSTVIGSIEITYTPTSASDPSISAEDVNLTYNATSGLIEGEIENYVEGTISASTEASWISNFTYEQVGESFEVGFTTTANSSVIERTATVTLTYTYGSQTVSKSIIVTQAGDPNAPGTQNNPYTVAQAIANTPSSGNVYIQGIVSSFHNTSIMGDGSNYRYYISDDGGTTTQLLVYKGKGLNQVAFSNVNDLLVGDEVMIYGSLITYNNAPEVASGNYLYSWNRPAVDVEAPTFSPVAGTYAEAQNVTISCATTGATIYYTLDGTEPTDSSTEYTNAIAVSTTTTIKAIAYVGSEASTVAIATYHINSQDNPYTVAQALAFNEYPANGIYVYGIVSTAPTSLSSGTLTYYISDDGTTATQLEVYKGKDLNNEAFTAADDIQVGDIVTIYGNVVIYNGTKEFSSGNYLVSFERPAQQYTLTVSPSENVEIYTFVGGSTGQGVEGTTTQQVTSGTTVGISVSAAEGYVLVLVVDDTDVTSQLDESGWYEFTMPAHNVNVTATASVAPVVTTNTYTLATSIESGKQYIIVGWANGTPYAMGYQKSNNRHAVEISVTGDNDENASATIANTETNPHEFTITSLGNGYYSIMDATTSGGYLYAAASSSNNLKTETTLDENHNGDWKITITDGSFSVVAEQSSNRNVMQFNNSDKLFACYASASQHPVFLYVKDETPVTETFTKPIVGWNNYDNPDASGWYLIASPIGQVAPGNVANMIAEPAANYDLFIFDQTNESEWQNYKQGHFSKLVPGTGYLYANKNTVDLEFTGTAYTGDGTFPLVYSKENPDAFMHGWNLMGNPYAESASVNRPYYTLNGDFEYELAEEDESVEAMEGIFVHVTEAEYIANQYVTFTPVSQQQQGGSKGSSLTLNLNKGGKLLDRAIISFSQGHTLPKFQFNRNHTKVYIPQDGQDYAIVRSDEMGEMPVNFKAENDGTYSLSFSSRNAEFAYLHLIDNMTGKDIDLLQTQSYSFEARTTDYESRFKLVFATGDNSKDDNFAFFSNGSFVINNEGNATLQVIDVTGRIISSESVNGCTNVNVNAAPGVYMLRLVNGENVRVQKVVVK